MAQKNAPAQRQSDQGQPPALSGPRLPYHPMIEERFGVDKAAWKALCEAVFPAAQQTESVILALSYCRARNLDPFKKNVHIVPVWDKDKRCLVDTVWPGIGELRTTAFRTSQYAGRDKTEFGPDITQQWKDGNGNLIELTFPEWAQVTVYRMKDGQRIPFAGPQVYWMETYSEQKGGLPNSMWRKRPRGQLDKCAEAAALRAAFPEELGDEYSEAEAGMIYQHGKGAQDGVPHQHQGQKGGAQPAQPGARTQLESFRERHGQQAPAEPQAPSHDPETGEVAEPVDATPCPPAPQAARTPPPQRRDTTLAVPTPVYGEDGAKVGTYADRTAYVAALGEALRAASVPALVVQANHETAAAVDSALPDWLANEAAAVAEAADGGGQSGLEV